MFIILSILAFELHLITPWLLRILLHGFHLFIHSFTHSFIHPFMHTFIYPSTHLFMHTFIHPFIHTFIHAHIHFSFFNYLTSQRYSITLNLIKHFKTHQRSYQLTAHKQNVRLLRQLLRLKQLTNRID